MRRNSLDFYSLISMILKNYNSVEDFLTAAQPFLEKRETTHNALLGNCFRLLNAADEEKNEAYLATVERNTRIAAAALQIRSHHLLLSHVQGNVENTMQMLATDLNRKRDFLPGVLAPVEVAHAFVKLWTRERGVTYKIGMSLRVFQISKVTFPRNMPDGKLRVATETDSEIVSRWVHAFSREALAEDDQDLARKVASQKIQQNMIYLWEDWRVVSMAAKSRHTRNAINLTFVYTPPELRGKGYASACVATLSELLLSQGWKYCTLSTDLANPTSNSVYQKIGYEPVCDMYRIDFG